MQVAKTYPVGPERPRSCQPRLVNGLLVVAAVMLAADGSAQSPRLVTVEGHGAKATITALPCGPGTVSPELRVSVVAPKGAEDWDYRAYLDAEDTGAPAAEILTRHGREYLFVRAYSGGAHCCWSLLVFDLHRLRALGEQVRSQTPIELVQGRHGCSLGAIALPLDRHELGGPMAKSTLYCFDGREFARTHAKVSMPFATCLGYGPEVVQLVGVTSRQTFPGRPNYESVERGDAPETGWLLKLERPVCLQADREDETNVAESDVTSVQIVLHDFHEVRPLLGRKVRVTGRLFHSFSGHHHTNVLIDASRIEREP